MNTPSINYFQLGLLILFSLSQVTVAEEQKLYIISDATAKYSLNEDFGWEALDFDDSSWKNVAAPSTGLCPAEVPPLGEPLNIWSQPSEVAEFQTIYVRKTFTIDTPKSGKIDLDVDDDFDLYVNGSLVGRNWDSLAGQSSYDISGYLETGKNVIAIKAADTAGFCQSLLFEVTMIIDQVNLTVTKVGEGTVTGEGIDCGTDCQTDYPKDTQVTLTAIPAQDSSLVGWSNDCSGELPNTTLLMDSSKICTVTFASPPILTVTKIGEGTVTGESLDCGTDCQTDYPLNTQVTLTAVPAQDSILVGWSNACTGNLPSVTVLMDSSKTCTVTFAKRTTLPEQPLSPVVLTVTKVGEGSVVGQGIDCGTDCSKNYPKNTEVTLTATPAEGYILVGWSSDCGNELPTITILMATSKTCIVTFKRGTALPPSSALPGKLSLFIEIQGQGRGQVTSFPKGIDCSCNAATMKCEESACSEFFPTGTKVILQAEANQGSVWSSWGGDPDCSDGEVSLYNSKLCIAYFQLIPVTLTVTGVEHGQVTSQPTGIDCNEQCSVEFETNQTVTLTFLPEAGWELVSWEGDCDAVGSVRLTTDKICHPVVQARKPLDYLLTIATIGPGKGTVLDDLGQIHCGNECTQEYPSETLVHLMARANQESKFIDWHGDCKGSEPAITVAMTAAKTCQAHFETLPPPPVTPPPADNPPLDPEPIPNYLLTVSRIGIGEVTSEQGDISCGEACSQEYAEGTQVRLTAHPGPRGYLVGWSGACQGQELQVVVEMREDLQCEARFESIPVPPPTVLLPPEERLPPAAIHYGCPTSGKIKEVCNYEGQILTDLEVLKSGTISNGILLDSTLINQGWVANLTITSHSVLTGGIVTGYIQNEGRLENFEFRGISLTGGLLAGTIRNTSTIGGYLKDVKLAPNASIQGGRLSGYITGDSQAPAKLENVTILAGSHLAATIFGDNVKVEKGVTIELGEATRGPQFPSLGQAPATDINGNTMKTNAKFWGGSVIGSKRQDFKTQVVAKPFTPVTLQSRLIADSAHLGESAEVVVYGTYQASLEEAPISFMINSKGKFCRWDENPTHLVAFRKQVTLADLVIEIYKCLPIFPGVMKLYVGYRLKNGTLVSHSLPLELIGTEQTVP